MIFVRDRGRMANNILQYGHVYAWGREHGRQTMSMRFAYKYRYFHICHTRHHNFLTYLFAKYAAKAGFLPVVNFAADNADYTTAEQEMVSRKNLIVEGWYARWYDLFLKYKADIIRLFAFDDNIEQHTSKLLHEGLRIGVHIRRGDYANFYGGRFLYSDEQYLSVIRSFIQQHPNEQITIYICGNDPNLNHDYYLQMLSHCKVIFPEGNPGQDLCLLSHCHYLIGAPSTFTLVAAMYRDTPLYWIEDPTLPVKSDSFKTFNYLFQHIY
jgi:hypothetical protein